MNNIKEKNLIKIIISPIFTILIAIGAFIKIPLPYVPFSLQFLFVNLSGIFLGYTFGSYSILLYIILGLIGFPIFSKGGGIGYILQPTFGYIIGFLVSTFLIGKITIKIKSSFINHFIISLLKLCIVYFIGVLYYYLISNFYLITTKGIIWIILYGIVIFIPGDIIICFISSFIAVKYKNFKL